jgi:repressor LexA
MLPTAAGAGQPLSPPLRRLAQVLRAIEAYLRRYDRPPSVRDLCRVTGIPSISYVFFLLAELELEGYITREPGMSRSIRLARPLGVPILGTIPVGMAQDLVDARAPETLDVAA